MPVKAAPPAPELDPARRDGDTVGALAAAALQIAAHLLGHVAGLMAPNARLGPRLTELMPRCERWRSPSKERHPFRR